MTKATLAQALECLGLEICTEAVETRGASGAGVHRVRAGSEDAVLKVTGSDESRELARRELTFYRTMAGRMPISTPRLLRSLDDEHVTALLLTAHRPSPPAREWDLAAWLDLASQLAVLHALPIPSENHWLGTSWLSQALNQPSSADGYWFKTSAADSARLALRHTGELADALRSTGDCFVHGDCHVENLLREGNELVWADWQNVGVGSPAGELAFLWSRADADGAEVPYDAMLDVYLSYREADPVQLRRALIAAELGILLFGWPAHAAYCAPAVQERLARRLVQLTDRWLSGAT
ncbi:aminoglycoside phosphotransferase family protein [Kribbella sp. CA-253562]|uniref:aminoglycoside phosphotransferase family protein n=1 Tax=Kribbella sp. CA-253562 TaxID=3239942 RepID=UPI003D8CB8AD